MCLISHLFGRGVLYAYSSLTDNAAAKPHLLILTISCKDGGEWETVKDKEFL
jgi:hypothetical protein